MPEQRYIEVSEPLTDFTGCVLSPLSDNKTILLPDGRVECPPEFGNWTGRIEFVDEPFVQGSHGYIQAYRGYRLHFDGPARPTKVKIFRLTPIED